MKNKIGLTLIEVLIALAILSIALTAVIKTTSQNIKNTLYLQNKMLANWLGLEVINETRAGILKLPMAPSSIKHTKKMLGQNLRWEARLNTTPNKQILTIDVDIFLKENSDALMRLKGYFYAR